MITLRTAPDGHLEIQTADGWKPVRPVRCFPWTSPNSHYSLRDFDGKELAFVANTSDLDPASLAALNSSLAIPAFVFEVTRITRIGTDIELRVWEVDTNHGPRRFQTEMDTWPENLPGGLWLLRDVCGDLYRIPSPENLDPTSAKLFWAFLD